MQQRDRKEAALLFEPQAPHVSPQRASGSASWREHSLPLFFIWLEGLRTARFHILFSALPSPLKRDSLLTKLVQCGVCTPACHSDTV